MRRCAERLPKIEPPTLMECSQWVYGEADPSLDVFQEEPNYYGGNVKDYYGFDSSDE